MTEPKPRIWRGQTARWRELDDALIEKISRLVGALNETDDFKLLFERHNPSGHFAMLVPCENNCGKTMARGERVLEISSKHKKRHAHYFCSVVCQRQHVVSLAVDTKHLH